MKNGTFYNLILLALTITTEKKQYYNHLSINIDGAVVENKNSLFREKERGIENDK